MNSWLDRSITLLLLVLLGWAGWSVLHWLLVGADWSVVPPPSAVCGGQFPCGSTLASVAVDGSTDHADAADPRWSEAWLGSPLVAVGLDRDGTAGALAVGRRFGAAAGGDTQLGGLRLTLLLTGGSGAWASVGIAWPSAGAVSCRCVGAAPPYRADAGCALDCGSFFGQLLILLFLPPELEINRVLRAVVAFALFAAAYIAEDVRECRRFRPPSGKLQPCWGCRHAVLQLVVLPQALRVALPSLTNQAVGLLQTQA